MNTVNGWEGFTVCTVKDSYVRGEFGGLHADPAYKQENASAFFGCAIPHGEAQQHCEAAHHQTQVASVEQVCRGQPEDSCEDSPSELDINAQANEDHARHL